MKFASSKKTLRATLLLTAVAICIGVSGCAQGAFDHRTNLKNVSESMLSSGGEEYFFAGPITYQVQISRQLNPFSTQDVQYFAGLKSAQNLPASELWYGVFLWAKNQSGHNAVTSDHFVLVTSDGTRYKPTKLNPTVNQYAWTSQTLAPNGIEPAADSTAAGGPTEGALVLFKVSYAIYNNRPLTLEVFAPGVKTPSTVSLDL